MNMFQPGEIVAIWDCSGGKSKLYWYGEPPESELIPLTRWEVLCYRVGGLFRWVRPLWWKVCPGAERRYFEKIKGAAMNRRSFLKLAGLAPVALAIPALAKPRIPPCRFRKIGFTFNKDGTLSAGPMCVSPRFFPSRPGVFGIGIPAALIRRPCGGFGASSWCLYCLGDVKTSKPKPDHRGRHRSPSGGRASLQHYQGDHG